MSLGVGARLGHYAVTAKLGQGGMGEVWRAMDTQLNRDVALKIVPEAFAFLRFKTMIEPIKQDWVADSDIQQGKLVWIGHDGRARLTLSFQGVPPTGYNWEAEFDVKAGETGTFIRREKRRAHE